MEPGMSDLGREELAWLGTVVVPTTHYVSGALSWCFLKEDQHREYNSTSHSE